MSRPSTKGFFVKERLAEARDARGITQSDLGKSLHKSGSTISNWERGEQAPEPNSLDQLARTLHVSQPYFLRQMPDYGTSAIFFRSLSNATARVRTREKARVRWLQHISLSLQNALEFPGVNFPEFVEPGAYVRFKEDDLERIALAMREHWDLGEGPISNMLLVAENAGVVVGIDEVGSAAIDGQGTWSAADERPYILLACDKNTAFRRQMDVAHEIAHLVLHRGVDEHQLERDFDLIEYQAKYLACALLLPDRSFASEISSLSLDGFLSLKSRWMVSVGAMIMRARQLEILSDEAATRYWKYRAARGWHRREPLDLPNETPVEEPRLLRRSIEMIVAAGVRSKRDLLESDICLSGADVEMLAALARGYFSESGTLISIAPRLRERPQVEQVADVIAFRRPN